MLFALKLATKKVSHFDKPFLRLKFTNKYFIHSWYVHVPNRILIIYCKHDFIKG